MDFKPEQLYILILEAESLTDDQKKAYIKRLNTEGVTDALAKELMKIFAEEGQRLDNFLEIKRKELKKAKENLASAEKEAQPKVFELLQNTEKQLTDAEKEYKRTVTQEVEIPLEKEVESLKKKEEQGEIDTIRNKLKIPPRVS